MSVWVIIGGQYGSEGKGKMVSYLAVRDRADAVIRCGGPNAGHTVCLNGDRHILRQIPAGVTNPATRLLIAAGAVVDVPLLLDEIHRYAVGGRLGIDRNAAVLSERDRQAEREIQLGKRIASTLSGTGLATSRKVLRDAGLRLAKDVRELAPWLTDVSEEASHIHDAGGLVLVEGTQGFGLSLHHGDEYPYRTSRDTTAAAFLSEAGLSPLMVENIVMVVRTYPIRVSGNSGPFKGGELSWGIIRDRSGYPADITEMTSVTKKVRRVAEFDMDLVIRAARINRPTIIAVHGLDYLDYHNFGKTSLRDLTQSTQTFVRELELAVAVPATFLFTGPPEECLIDRRAPTDYVESLRDAYPGLNMEANESQWLWVDPIEASLRGPVLLSDEIRFFSEKLHLVWPYEEDSFRPAAYDLHVGTEFYVDDKPVEQNWYDIPPNGLVYVRTKETFNIPYYLVARYSLQVTQVYRGLLIDNGLHIDPGYRGYIWIPVHNFTTQTRKLASGDKFLSVEFNRTTALPDEVKNFRVERDLILAAERRALLGVEKQPLVLFFGSVQAFDAVSISARTPKFFWDKRPGETHKSAMIGVEERLSEVRKEVDQDVRQAQVRFADQFDKRLETIRSWGSWAALVLVVALLGVLLPIFYSQMTISREAATKQTIALEQLERKVNDLAKILTPNQQNAIEELRSAIRDLQQQKAVNPESRKSSSK